MALRSRARGETWQPVCALVTLPVERGVTALLHGASVAVFRSFEDQVYALANHDPYDRVAPLARGIVGMRGDVPFVASLQHRHAFDLRTGVCLEDPSVSVATYPVRIVNGTVLVGPRAPH